MYLFRFALVSALLVFGCKGAPKPDDLPKLHPVRITITQEGTPLAGANVLLLSDSPDDKWTPGGTTDAQGVVAPNTQGRYPGVPAGRYKVCVSKTETEKIPGRDETYSGPPSKAVRLVDVQYGDPDTTPLEIEVGNGKNVQNFDVGKAVREALANDP